MHSTLPLAAPSLWGESGRNQGGPKEGGLSIGQHEGLNI